MLSHSMARRGKFPFVLPISGPSHYSLPVAGCLVEELCMQNSRVMSLRFRRAHSWWMLPQLTRQTLCFLRTTHQFRRLKFRSPDTQVPQTDRRNHWSSDESAQLRHSVFDRNTFQELFMLVFSRNIGLVIFFATSFLYLAGVMLPSAYGDGYGGSGGVACPICTTCPSLNARCTGPKGACINCDCDGTGSPAGCL